MSRKLSGPMAGTCLEEHGSIPGGMSWGHLGWSGPIQPQARTASFKGIRTVMGTVLQTLPKAAASCIDSSVLGLKVTGVLFLQRDFALLERASDNWANQGHCLKLWDAWSAPLGWLMSGNRESSWSFSSSPPPPKRLPFSLVSAKGNN